MGFKKEKKVFYSTAFKNENSYFIYIYVYLLRN